MNHTFTLLTALLTALLLAPLAALHAADAPKQQPNIIVIFADDMGYSDIGCYGSEIATPSLDSLAKNGVRFTQSYNAARCCPTRAALLTGLYSHQAGIGLMEGYSGFDGYRGELSRKAVTVAEVLRPMPETGEKLVPAQPWIRRSLASTANLRFKAKRFSGRKMRSIFLPVNLFACRNRNLHHSITPSLHP